MAKIPDPHAFPDTVVRDFCDEEIIATTSIGLLLMEINDILRARERVVYGDYELYPVAVNMRNAAQVPADPFYDADADVTTLELAGESGISGYLSLVASVLYTGTPAEWQALTLADKCAWIQAYIP